jgi:hypothetical protein
VHLQTKFTKEMLKTDGLGEWLKENHYDIRFSSSQTEELITIGLLLYSSVFLFRENLKENITKDDGWNPDEEDFPFIFDLSLREFAGPQKRVPMIFVSAEKSKAEQAVRVFSSIYNGAHKDYPNNAPMLFIPLLRMDHSPEYRKKLIYNHEAFLGDEDAITVTGIKCLDSLIVCKHCETPITI